MTVAPCAETLHDLLFRNIGRIATRTAIATMDDSITYAQLRDLSTNFAAHLRRHGIGRDACVALNISHPIIAIGMTMGCAMVGAAWAPATVHVGESSSLRITHLLYDGPSRGNDTKTHLRVDPGWAQPPDRAGVASGFEGYASAADPWMITQSSGTTGTPKLIAESEPMICQRAVNSVDPALPATPVYVCLFPPLSPPALVHGLGVLSIGGTLVFAQITELLGRARVDCVLGAPNQFLSLLETEPTNSDRIPLARIAGAPASKTFLTRLLRYFSGVTYTYASTEASVVVANLITSVENLPENISLGRPIPNVELCIVGEDGAVLPPGREGIVKLRAPWQVNEYVGDPALSATVFRDGWFYPGDLGYVSESGELTITGRVNEQLNIGGEKLNPTVIDTALLASPGIKDAACFARRNAQGVDQLEAVISVAGPMELPVILATLAQRLAARFEGPHIPRKIYVAPELPRLPNGKIARQSLPDATRGFAAHDLVPRG